MALTLDGLADLLGQGVDRLRLRGVCREHRDSGTEVVQAVWVDADLLRVEEPPGRLDTLVGPDHVWHHDPSSDRVHIKPRSPDVPNPYTSPRILQRRDRAFYRQLLSSDGAQTAEKASRVVLHGRNAVEIDLHGKGGVLNLVVDEATGTWLRALRDGRGWMSWDWVVFDDALDRSVFVA